MQTDAPVSIRDILADSLNQPPVADGTFNEIYALKSPDTTLDDYLLRVRHGGAHYIKEKLTQTTALTPPHLAALTVPDFLFTGPSVSQSLLHLGADGKDEPILEIIPRQQGVPLFKYISGENEEFDAVTQYAKRIELMKELSKPESTELKNLMMQVAFIATQKPSFKFLDVNGGSIMLEQTEKGIHLHLLDIVGQEIIDRTGINNFGQPPDRTQPPEYTTPQEPLVAHKSFAQRIKGVFKRKSASVEIQPPVEVPPPIAEIKNPAEEEDRIQKWRDSEWRKYRKDNKLFMYLAYDPSREAQPMPFKGISSFLCDYLMQGMTEQDKDICIAFRKKLGGALKTAAEKSNNETMPSEWKGFQRMQKPEGHEVGIPYPLHMEHAEFISANDAGKIKARQISAVKLSDTPLALKHTLDKIRALAIPNER